MKEPGKDADKETVLARNRRDGCAKHEGKNNSRISYRVAAGKGGQKRYAEHDRRDVAQCFTGGGKADNGKNASDAGPVEFSANRKKIKGAENPINSHVD